MPSETVFALLTAIGINAPGVADLPMPITIEYVAPEGCASAEAFYQGVRARTNRVRRARAGEQGVQIHVRVLHMGTGIRGELRIGDASEDGQTRRVDGVSCREVVEALSLTAALAIDPGATLFSATSEQPGPNSGVGGQDKGADDDVRTAEGIKRRRSSSDGAENGTERAEPVASRQRSRWELVAHAMLAKIVSPGIALGPELGARWIGNSSVLPPLSIAMQGFRVNDSALGSASLGDVRLTGAGLVSCVVATPASETFELSPCVAANGAWLQASGVGVEHPVTVGRTWWAVAATMLASVQVYGSLRVESSAGFVIPLVRRQFATSPPEQVVGSTPWVSFLATLGVAYRY